MAESPPAIAARSRGVGGPGGGRAALRVSMAAVAVIAAAGLGGFAAGRWAGLERAALAADGVGRLAPLRSAMQDEAAALDAARRGAERRVRSLARRIGALQAEVIQMDALAARLARRSELRDVQFDFAADPPLGGPHETLADADGGATNVAAAAGSLALQLEDRRRKLAVLEDVLLRRRLDSRVRLEGRPVPSAYVSSRFGERIDPFTGRTAIHRGVDFAAPPGTDVVAVASGIVVWSGPREGYGEMIEIDHGHDYVTRYAHNSENLVAAGDVVSRGQPIARLGATGRATGPNLHFEVLRGGEAVNPLQLLD